MITKRSEAGEVKHAEEASAASGVNPSRPESDYHRLMDYALWLLGRRAYTCFQMRERLVQRGKTLGLWTVNGLAAADGGTDMNNLAALDRDALDGEATDRDALGSEATQAVITRVMDRLAELNYVNDVEFCKRWVAERSRTRPRGRYLLTQELRKKGITDETLDEFWAALEEKGGLDEVALAKRLMADRLPRLSMKYEGYDLKQRLYRHLVSRGIRHEAIQEAIRTWDDLGTL